MSINVNRPTTKSNLVIEQNKVQKQEDAGKSNNTKAASSNSDSVQLTEQAMNLNKMQKTNAGESQVNTKRVESIKAAILNGDYKINSEQLAEKIGKFESDFNKTFAS
ncbi:flagellar biosynthesis anti-sigma factor FlgM [Psychromonas algicola]|uniref:flagellar biosynthesis anti-sigma factor FlgM n=1 Tax=Psychromonas algicola TaxID=2555642 RepID=UPI0010682802|nr:flagellar biosynthesis anti-sigma factor FlgM [Psychromonas sp. RZ5]TEW46022.1 flagellar biosynthesis anti-sigma factor FlgM [Psychromonas sp. RZ5]